MKKKTKRTIAQLGGPAVLAGVGVVAAAVTVGVLLRRKLRYRHDAQLDPGIETHLNRPALSDTNPGPAPA